MAAAEQAEEIENLFLRQKEVASLIKNFSENTAKAKAADKFTASDYVTRSEFIEKQYWNPFYERHLKLLRYAGMVNLAERSYYKNNIFACAQEDYLNSMAWHRERADKLRPQPPTLLPDATALVHQQRAPQAAPTMQHSELEKLKLPKFSGRQLDWENFKERFNAMVGNDRTIPEVLKLQRLLGCLEGEAADMLRSLEISADSFQIGWERLRRRYDNSYLRLKCQLRALTQLPICTTESGPAINWLINTAIESRTVLRNIGEKVNHWDRVFIFFIEEKLPRQTRLDWAKQVEKEAVDKLPEWDSFQAFLENRVRTLEVVEYDQATADRGASKRDERAVPTNTHNSLRNQGRFKPRTKSSINIAVKSSNNKRSAQCKYCKAEHFIGFCKEFTNIPVAQRFSFAKSNSLCTNCLGSSHQIDACTSEGRCLVCGGKHHSKLHTDPTSARTDHSAARANTEATAEVKPSTQYSAGAYPAMLPTSPASRRVLLATACVKLYTEKGNSVTVRALLDSGAEDNYVTDFIVKALSLHKRSVSVVVAGIGGKEAAVASGCVRVSLKSNSQSEFSIDLSALVLRKLTSFIPPLEISNTDWPHLRDLQLADPHYYKSGRIDCILNAEIFSAIVQEGVRRGEQGEPTALLTSLGWVIMGCSSSKKQTATQAAIYHISAQRDLTCLLQRFWEIEEVSAETPLSPDDYACYEHFRATVDRDVSGRFIVHQSFKESPGFADTRTIAAANFARLERRFEKQPELAAAYRSFMHEYLQLGHMQLIPEEIAVPGSVYYLPHHPVVRQGDCRKIRVVFNASQPDSSGRSLNSTLHTGPKLQEDIAVILLRWRFFKYVFSCDICKMFRQFNVRDAYRDWQRIIWRFSPSSPIQSFQLKTVTYGTASAPFQANACML